MRPILTFALASAAGLAAAMLAFSMIPTSAAQAGQLESASLHAPGPAHAVAPAPLLALALVAGASCVVLALPGRRS